MMAASGVLLEGAGRGAAELEPGWVPGQRAAYHPASGWFMRGEVVRRVDSRAYPQYVREAICEPLGMADT